MAKQRLAEWAKGNGIEAKVNEKGQVKLDDSPQLLEMCKSAIFDGTCPAVCSEGCEVEPDGHCEHGAPSLLIVCGLI